MNIATHLICDALEDRYDTASLMSGDSDLVPAVETVRRLKPEKRITVAFPPGRYSKELEDATNNRPIHIWEGLLRKNRLPALIKRDGLPDIIRPNKYSGQPANPTPPIVFEVTDADGDCVLRMVFASNGDGGFEPVSDNTAPRVEKRLAHFPVEISLADSNGRRWRLSIEAPTLVTAGGVSAHSSFGGGAPPG